MKITIEATDRTTSYNGAPARVWRGNMEDGTEVAILVTLIGINSFFPHPDEKALTDVGSPDLPPPSKSTIDAMFPEFADGEAA